MTQVHSLRICRTCGATGPLDLFLPSKTSRFGRQNLCLECFRQRARRYARAQRERLGPAGRLAANNKIGARYAVLKYKAKVSGVVLSITLDQYETLLAQPCDYCGRPLALTGYGLDRKVPGGPFTLDNVVPCCGSCNELKGNRWTYKEAKTRLPSVVGSGKHG
jgi:hypothetical protein